jgi:hypothetical protein
MKKLFTKAKDFVYAHPYTCVGAVIVLLLLLGMCGCSDDDGGTSLPSAADVGGIYLVEEGFQTMKEEGKEEERTDFTAEDGIELPVEQSGSAVKLFICMGVLNEDLTVQCDQKVEVGFGGCQTNTGTITFNDDGTLTTTMHFDWEDPFWGNGSSDIELTMSRVRDICGEDDSGDS